MLNESISRKVLTVGCRYNPAKGGIAQVQALYSKYIYPTFKQIENSCGILPAISNFRLFVTGFFRCIGHLATHKEIELVHIHSSSYTSFYRSVVFVLIARIFRRKVLLHIHSGAFKDFYNSRPSFVKRELKKADGLIALSETWRHFFEDELGLRKVFVVPNPIEPPLKVAECHKEENFSLLFLGKICDDKGIFELLDVLKQIKAQQDISINLHIGGVGETERLQQVINDNDLSDIVTYDGWIDSKKKAELMSTCDMVVLPSHFEGLPLVVLEAFSYGKPVIATRVGAIPEIVTEGENGFLYDVGDFAELRRILVDCAGNREHIASLSRASKKASLNFMPDVVAGKLEEVYSALGLTKE